MLRELRLRLRPARRELGHGDGSFARLFRLPTAELGLSLFSKPSVGRWHWFVAPHRYQTQDLQKIVREYRR